MSYQALANSREHGLCSGFKANKKTSLSGIRTPDFSKAFAAIMITLIAATAKEL